jgi:hypothetical protein
MTAVSAAGYVLGHLLVLAGLAATYFVAGRRILARFAFSGRAEEIAFSLGLGAGACGAALFLLALCGLLDPAAVWALVLLVHALGWSVWRDLARRARAVRGLPRGAATAAALAVLAAPLFWLALYPPTAFDATMYHLPTARAFARLHSVEFLENLRNPVFPYFVESLQSGVLLVAGDVSTHFVEWLAMGAAALALFGEGRRRKSVAAGALAAAAWLSNPLVVYSSGAALVDLDLALFVLLSYAAWERFHRGGDRRWLALSGALAGFAAATKYLGLPWVLALAVLTLAAGPPRRVAHAVRVALWSVAAAAPWYVWIAASTGNPVFPFLPRIFGDTPWNKHGIFTLARQSVFVGLDPFWRPWWDFLRHGVGHPGTPFSPVYLAAAPLVVWAAARSGPALRASLLGAAWIAVLAGIDPRYGLPGVALLSLVFGEGASLLLDRMFGRRHALLRLAASGALGLALLAAGESYAVRLVFSRGGWSVLPRGRAAYLNRQISGYGAVAWLNRRHGSAYGVYGLYAENLADFARGRFLGDWRGPFRYERVLAFSKSPDKLAGALEAYGCGFLLEVVAARPGLVDAKDAAFRRRFRLVFSDSRSRLWAVEPSRRRAVW